MKFRLSLQQFQFLLTNFPFRDGDVGEMMETVQQPPHSPEVDGEVLSAGQSQSANVN